jgi:hypothetical protein
MAKKKKIETEQTVQEESPNETSNLTRVARTEIIENSSFTRLKKQLWDYFVAGVGGVYVNTHEADIVCRALDTMIVGLGGFVFRWDFARNITPINEAMSDTYLSNPAKDKLNEAFNTIRSAADAIMAMSKIQEIYSTRTSKSESGNSSESMIESVSAEHPVPVILLLENLDFAWGTPGVIQTFINCVKNAERAGLYYVVVGTDPAIPKQMSPYIEEIAYELPDRAVIESLAKQVTHEIMEAQGIPEIEFDNTFATIFPQDEVEQTFMSAKGLSESAIRTIFNLTYVAEQKITAQSVAMAKVQAIRKSSALDMFAPLEGGFSKLGGLNALKRFTLKSLKDRKDKSLFPKGILLTGIPGTGKSIMARALAAEVKLPIVKFSIGRLLDKFVGGSEKMTHVTLNQIDQMAPIILIIDELEKVISGSSAQASNSDGGTMRRALGSILSWLQDKTSEVYVVGTCNDIASLPPELTRAQRFDAIFFMDYPTIKERRLIWDIYLEKFNINRKDPLPDDTNWTGTEIEHCCYFSRLWGCSLREAAINIVPIHVYAEGRMNELRAKAHGAFLDATYGGIFNTDTRCEYAEEEKEYFDKLDKEEKLNGPQPTLSDEEMDALFNT